MMPTGSRVELPNAADLVCERISAIEVADNSASEEEMVDRISGTAATEVGSGAPADSVTAGCATGVVIDGGEGNGVDDGDSEGDAISAVSTTLELVGAILAGGSVGAAATCEERTSVSLDCEGALGVKTSGAGADG